MWVAPSLDQIKVNIDGNYLGNLGNARCGGLIQNYHEVWIAGFSYLLVKEP